MGGNLNKLEVNLRENTYLGKDPQNDMKGRKKIHKTPDTFRLFERQSSSLPLMKIKEKNSPGREKPHPELASPSPVNTARKERAAGKEFPLSADSILKPK